MRLFFNTLIVFSVLVIPQDTSYPLTNNEIKEMCKTKLRRANCIKIFKNKKLNLLRGKRIEIPVVPFKN